MLAICTSIHRIHFLFQSRASSLCLDASQKSRGYGCRDVRHFQLSMARSVWFACGCSQPLTALPLQLQHDGKKMELCK